MSQPTIIKYHLCRGHEKNTFITDKFPTNEGNFYDVLNTYLTAAGSRFKRDLVFTDSSRTSLQVCLFFIVLSAYTAHCSPTLLMTCLDRTYVGTGSGLELELIQCQNIDTGPNLTQAAV